jgi:hypothetical protein
MQMWIVWIAVHGYLAWRIMGFARCCCGCLRLHLYRHGNSIHVPRIFRVDDDAGQCDLLRERPLYCILMLNFGMFCVYSCVQVLNTWCVHSRVQMLSDRGIHARNMRFASAFDVSVCDQGPILIYMSGIILLHTLTDNKSPVHACTQQVSRPCMHALNKNACILRCKVKSRHMRIHLFTYTWRTHSLHMPHGELVKLSSAPKEWKADGVSLVLPAAAGGRASSVRVACGHDLVEGEIVRHVAGYHLALHPLRLLPFCECELH